MKMTPWAIIGLLIVALFYQEIRYTTIKTSRNLLTTDTLIYIDTIRHYELVPKDTLIYKYKYIKVPIRPTKQAQVSDIVADTATKDSVAIQIPITQKHYNEKDYEAWVSGYDAKIDSLYLKTKHTQIQTTISNPSMKPKRWGLGVQVGVGVTSGHAQPYIGVGVSYNLFSW